MNSDKKTKLQEPHKTKGVRDNSLEIAIGRQVRTFRANQGMTVVKLANMSSLSAGMLSKIERGLTSPSLATLRNLADSLHVPVTTLFRRYEEERDVSFVKAGEGLNIERRGTRAGHQYQLLGHTVGKSIGVEPYLITLTEESDVFPIFQHSGVEFIHMLEGKVDYRHGNNIYTLTPGDSIFFDADAPHGPEVLTRLPIRFISIIVYPAQETK